MRYSEDNKEIFFNEEMILSEEGNIEYSEHFRQWRSEVLNHPAAWFGSMMPEGYGEDKGPAVAGGVSAVVFFGGIIATIFCIANQKYEYIPYLLGLVMAVMGIVSVIFPVVKGSKVFSESALAIRIEGVIGVVGGIVLTVMGLMLPKGYVTSNNMLVFGVVCVVVALVILIKTIGILRAPKSIYTEEVNATCIGYVRTFESGNNDSGGSNLVPVNSPLFEYYYGGEKYRSYYDLWNTGKDGKIPVGSACVIKISPDEPSRVLGSCGKYAVTPGLFAFMALIAAVVLLVLA